MLTVEGLPLCPGAQILKFPRRDPDSVPGQLNQIPHASTKSLHAATKTQAVK